MWTVSDQKLGGRGGFRNGERPQRRPALKYWDSEGRDQKHLQSYSSPLNRIKPKGRDID